MSLHKNENEEKRQLNNEIVYECSKEELKEIVEKYGIDKDTALNYHLMVAMPPKRQKTKSGLYIPDENSDTEQFKTSVGRILSRGTTVGQGELLKDCRNLEVGDYVKYAYFAAGLPETYKGILVKYIVDDQIKGIVKNPNDIDKLYDF